MSQSDRVDGAKKSRGAIALTWWAALQPNRDGDGRRGDPGALARLRRASLADAMIEGETVRLHRMLGLPREKFSRSALLACALAHVREHLPGGRVAPALGPTAGDERGLLSPLRFRRLLAARSEEDCAVAFRRLVARLDGKTNVADLADSLLDWPDEISGDARRRRWAFDYYGASFAAPSEAPEAAPDSAAPAEPA